jgi:hypothetical protein
MNRRNFAFTAALLLIAGCTTLPGHESVIEVPVTAPAMRIAHQLFGVMRGGAFGTQRFETSGEFPLKPPAPAEAPTPI